MLRFFFNDTATTEIYTLSLHDALPISNSIGRNVTPSFTNYKSHADLLSEIFSWYKNLDKQYWEWILETTPFEVQRSEEHTSELQSRQYLVCRLLLEKKKHRSVNTAQHQ